MIGDQAGNKIMMLGVLTLSTLTKIKLLKSKLTKSLLKLRLLLMLNSMERQSVGCQNFSGEIWRQFGSTMAYMDLEAVTIIF